MNALIDHRDALARGAERAPERGVAVEHEIMHEQAMTLKHYLKVVPTRPDAARRRVRFVRVQHQLQRVPQPPHRPNADDEIHRLVPNTGRAYTVSPYRVVHRETAQSFGSSDSTELCAVVGGVFTSSGSSTARSTTASRPSSRIENQAIAGASRT